MRALLLAVIGLVVFLQYKMWVAPDGFTEVIHIRQEIRQQHDMNQALLSRNQQLSQQVHDLKHGYQTVEAKARQQMGMIQNGEVFYQFRDDE